MGLNSRNNKAVIPYNNIKSNLSVLLPSFTLFHVTAICCTRFVIFLQLLDVEYQIKNMPF